LEELYGYDNSEFLTYLTENGFYIANQSQTNYMVTLLSLSATLNFEYHHQLPISNRVDIVNFKDLLKNASVIPILREQGYKVIIFESGYILPKTEERDFYLSNFVSINAFERLLITSLPELNLLNKYFNLRIPLQDNQTHRTRILYALEELKKVPSVPGPKFVYVHLLLPHPPFVFDENGNPIQPDYPFQAWDGSDFPGTLEEYLEGYINQVQYVNSELAETINTILDESESPPIIILQGDHGPGALLDWTSEMNSCIWERGSILNAYYFPGGKYDLLYESISPVNSFRVIFDTFFGSNLGILEDRTFFSSRKQASDPIDVTDKLGLKANCTLP